MRWLKSSKYNSNSCNALLASGATACASGPRSTGTSVVMSSSSPCSVASAKTSDWLGTTSRKAAARPRMSSSPCSKSRDSSHSKAAPFTKTRASHAGARLASPPASAGPTAVSTTLTASSALPSSAGPTAVSTTLTASSRATALKPTTSSPSREPRVSTPSTSSASAVATPSSRSSSASAITVGVAAVGTAAPSAGGHRNMSGPAVTLANPESNFSKKHSGCDRGMARPRRMTLQFGPPPTESASSPAGGRRKARAPQSAGSSETLSKYIASWSNGDRRPNSTASLNVTFSFASASLLAASKR
mmetsp:Transcript_19028/g.55217  ORF Transcript_19028/g.55217 Transcript_19028/m.55217 type:complete len:303 (+) Transcript_19028:685-1593(+)